MKDIKKKLVEIVKYLLIFLCFYVLSKANIMGIIFPFAFGFLYALIWCNQKVYVVCPLYILAFTLAKISLASLIISSCSVIIIMIAYIIHLKLKKPIKPYLLILYALISQFAYIYLNVLNGTQLIIILTTVVLGIMFLLACVSFMSAMVTKGITNRLKLIEKISGCVLIIAFSCAFNSITVYSFEPVKLMGVLLILLLNNTSKFSLFFGVVWGLGTLLNGANAVLVAPFVLFALACLPFKQNKRIVSVLVIIVIETVIGYVMKLYYSFDYFSYLPILLSGILFVLIPQSWLDQLSANFNNANNIAMRNIVNRNRESLRKRFLCLSDVFCDMDGVFRSMIKGGLSKQQACVLVLSEIKEKLCAGCSEKNKCHRIFDKEITTVLNDLIIISLERQEITLLDIPPFLTTRCLHINGLVSLINENAKQLKQYASFMNSVDSGKLLVAQQLSGISSVMKNLADEVGKNILFDNEKENKLIEVLNYNNVICGEALIYQQNPNILNVTLALKNKSENKKKVSKIVSKVLGLPMSINGQSNSSKSGYTLYSLKNTPKFDIVFGTAGTPKLNNQVSGDCYSLIRLEDDKFIMAICDGMGNGETAEDVSSLTLGLVENFYKAGFDNELILNVVNNLLNIKNEDELFSAIDLCIVDLKNGLADFIKLGANIGFVKHITHTSSIKCESMPIGIIKEIKPVVNKIVLSAGDIIILCSDGISDTFENEEVFCEYINNIEEVNPQEIANEILDMAKKNCNDNYKDDMTVIVGRLYQN